MSDFIIGYFPEDIVYYSCPLETVHSANVQILSKPSVSTTFVADKNNDLTNKKAEKLSFYYTKDKSKIKKTILKNTNIKNIKLIDTYNSFCKVLIDDFYYVNLNSSILLDCILNEGINFGEFKSEFKWANIKGVLQLIRVGSSDEKLIHIHESKMNMKKISKRALTVGNIYENLKNEKAIFLGFVNTTKYLTTYQSNNFQYKKDKINKAMIFYKINKESDIYNHIKRKEISTNKLKIVRNHNYLIELNKVDINFDIISNIKKMYVNFVRKEFVDLYNKKITERNLHFIIRNYSMYLNINDEFDFQRYFNFI